MTEQQGRQRQATWKTLLIIGIVASAAWLLFSDFPAEFRGMIGVVAAIGLGGGLILFICRGARMRCRRVTDIRS